MMQTKRFTAADMRRALTLVRDELGDDAMILSTQRTAKGVEIVATTDNLEKSSAGTVRPGISEATRAALNQSQKSQPQNSQPSMAQKPAFLQTHNSHAQVGLASGKTQAELAQEMEVARRKAMAMQAKQQDKMTLTEWAEQNAAADQASKLRSQPSPYSQPSQPQSGHTPTDSTPVSAQVPTLQPASIQNDNISAEPSIAEREIERLHEEIISMRSTFEHQLEALSYAQERQFEEQKQNQAVVPLASRIKQRLSTLGLNEKCRDRLLRSLRMVDGSELSEQDLWKESLARLSRMIPANTDDPVARGGVYAFLGTTGVGKTTTIAKLAARYVMKHGPDKVALLTTDTFRIGAHDQLRSLGRILNVKVKVVDDLRQLPAIVEQYSRQSLVLIDTPGMRFNDPLLSKHLSALKRCRHVQNCLVLSANSQYQMMQASVHNYRLANPRFCVMTKLDECASLGDALSVLASNKLPMAYTTDGQAVPDDLAVIKPHQLVAKALKLSKQGLHLVGKAVTAKAPA